MERLLFRILRFSLVASICVCVESKTSFGATLGLRTLSTVKAAPPLGTTLPITTSPISKFQLPTSFPPITFPRPPYRQQVPTLAFHQITLDLTDLTPISPLIYGVNYDWHTIPAANFPRFESTLAKVANFSLMRAPSGWNGEVYNWETNLELPWLNYNPAQEAPGESIEGVLAADERLGVQTSFMAKSMSYIQNHQPGGLKANVKAVQDHVREFGGRVKIWEIGNEWYNLSRAEHEQDLGYYAELVAAEAPAMKAVNPSISIYINGDWQHPEDFKRMRELIGTSAWASVDGFVIHTGCGNGTSEAPCETIPARVAEVRAITGKEKVYVSEWLVSYAQKHDSKGLEHAGRTMIAIGDLVKARVTAAAYWPPAVTLPAIALIDDRLERPTVIGQAFQWMQQDYNGFAVGVRSDTPAFCALNNGQINVIIPSQTKALTEFVVPVPPGTQLASARVISAKSASLTEMTVGDLPVVTSNGLARFVLNEHDRGNGYGFEIAKLEFAAYPHFRTLNER